MEGGAYDKLAGVYDWLVPDALLTPEGSAAAFAGVVDGLASGARVLDCAAGTGQLAVGLALRGFDVVASDASSAMIDRTRQLALRHGADVPAVACTWKQLAVQGFERFDAVFCVGNSLTHAAGRDDRRAALSAMAGVIRERGVLVLTSRNWELVRREGSGLRVADRLLERDGVQGLVVYGWTIPAAREQPHVLDVAVALMGEAGTVRTHGERTRFWPFTHAELHEDLRAAGLEAATSTYAADVERYLVTAIRGA